MSGRAYDALRERMADVSGVVMLIGAAETGKTTLSKLLILDALDAGLSVAFVDGDVASTIAGPPMPMFEPAVAMTTSQQPSNAALPAKQRPELTPTRGTLRDSSAKY